MICVSYTRTMGWSILEEPAADTISVQNRSITEYAAKRKWKIAKKYSDRKHDRNEDTAFRALKEDGIAQKYDCVIIDSMQHFGITGYHAYDLLSVVFLPAGIHFAVVEDDFCSADVSREESQSYLDKKRYQYRILHTKETTGRYLEDRVYEKYGYRHKDGVMELVIDENVADNIRTIFHLMSEGNTIKSATQIMNERGIEAPNVYMRRIGAAGKRINTSVWLESQVGSIIRNPIYIGKWERTIECKKVIVPCPAIVSEEIFEKVQAILNSRRCGTRIGCKPSNNAFGGILFDKDSGLTLHQYRSQTTGEKLFRLKYPKPDYIEYPKMSIMYDYVEATVRDMLSREQEKAKLALRMFETKEFQEYKANRLDLVRQEAQAIFRQMTDLEYSSWQSQSEVSLEGQQTNDEKLQRILNQITELDRILSADNAWIRLFADMKLPDTMRLKDLQKYVVSATCEKFESIKIEIREKEEFLQLPQEWFGKE